MESTSRADVDLTCGSASGNLYNTRVTIVTDPPNTGVTKVAQLIDVDIAAIHWKPANAIDRSAISLKKIFRWEPSNTQSVLSFLF